MKIVNSISVDEKTKKENISDFTLDFPYVCSQANISDYEILWHWHEAFELFYIQSGELEYFTPQGKMTFEKGTGGLINSNIIHRTTALSKTEKTVQLLHIFDKSFLSGGMGTRIERKFFTPLHNNFQIEIIPIKPVSAIENKILDDLKQSFTLKETDFGYELKLRNVLSEIWLNILEILPRNNSNTKFDKMNLILKPMLIYIHENYNQKITVNDIAHVGCVSLRECYRIFNNGLNISPIEYINEYRLQIARQLLTKTDKSITQICMECGFGSSSFFGKVFKNKYRYTPKEYRKNYQEI